jgi:hypothetical protein
MKKPNKITGANSRPASPLDAGRQFGSASCAPPSLSAAVAQFCRCRGRFASSTIAADDHPQAARRAAPHNQRMQQTIPSASKLASGLAPDPQRLYVLNFKKTKKRETEVVITSSNSRVGGPRGSRSWLNSLKASFACLASRKQAIRRMCET